MRKLALVIVLLLGACTPPVLEGGSNGNDRTDGGTQGEVLLTGAMVVSPGGDYALMQRNQTSVLVDIPRRRAAALAAQVDRWVFAKGAPAAFAVVGGDTVVSFALPAAVERWRYRAGDAITMLRVSDDDATVAVGSGTNLRLVDAATGARRAEIAVDGAATELAFVPARGSAIVAGTTRWADHKPATQVVEVNLSTGATRETTIANCAAPIAVTPDASRAFISPTFCEEGGASTPQSGWTNPDPVSVVDLSSDGPRFRENLPGFGPVALDEKGTRAVAYLDTQRMIPSMFADQTKVPPAAGPRYHIMRIDPATLAYDLTPIGDLLPRFAMTRDGSALLVDATVERVRGEASLKVNIDSSGKLMVSFHLFGSIDTLFGVFDLDKATFAPIAGPAASLDRFVQMGDCQRVFTLADRADGMGGDLYRIDVSGRTTANLNLSLRDIGLLPDGATMLLRERLPAVSVQNGTNTEWYRRERYWLSPDGINATWTLEYQDATPFQVGAKCTSYHDC
jgi:hypothetical protein